MIARMIDCQARISFIEGADLGVLTGVVSRHEDRQMTVRGPNRGGCVGAVAVVAIRASDGEVYRARAHIEAVSDLSVELILHEPLGVAERRLYARATVAARLRCRRQDTRPVGWLREVSDDEETDWLIEVIEISPSGMLAPLPGTWQIGEAVVLDLHIPGPGGGERLQLAGEIVRLFPERTSPAAAVRFIDLNDAAQDRLATVVDRQRLGIDLF